MAGIELCLCSELACSCGSIINAHRWDLQKSAGFSNVRAPLP